MRKITYTFKDFDVVSNELNVFEETGLLITPTIIFRNDNIGMAFYYLDEPVADNETVADVQTAHIVSVDVDGASAEEFSLENLANMTISELGQELASKLIKRRNWK